MVPETSTFSIFEIIGIKKKNYILLSNYWEREVYNFKNDLFYKNEFADLFDFVYYNSYFNSEENWKFINSKYKN